MLLLTAIRNSKRDEILTFYSTWSKLYNYVHTHFSFICQKVYQTVVNHDFMKGVKLGVGYIFQVLHLYTCVCNMKPFIISGTSEIFSSLR
jgi:hypothetical protein